MLTGQLRCSAMSITGEYPFEPGPGGPGGGSGQAARARSLAASLVSSVVILLGSALIGLAGGVAWTKFAPRAVYVVVGGGSAEVVNPETTAFIAADAWYCLIGVVGGLAIGLAGYLLSVRRYGPVPMAAILAGGVLAGLAARWVGENQGLHQFNRQLQTTPHGTLLHAPLGLAGDTSAAVWPPLASLPAVAFWPLAACGVAGGIVLMKVLRDRPARAYSRARHGARQFPSYPGQLAVHSRSADPGSLPRYPRALDLARTFPTPPGRAHPDVACRRGRRGSARHDARRRRTAARVTRSCSLSARQARPAPAIAEQTFALGGSP
jgi:hypothetical protein